jgi:hypothetical protein
MTARQDFTIDAGRDYQLSVALFEDDQTTPLNLLDCELEWIVSRSGVVSMLDKSSLDPAEIEVTSIGDGMVTIYIHASDTEQLGALTLDHELIVIDPEHSEATVFRGLVTILRTTMVS